MQGHSIFKTASRTVTQRRPLYLMVTLASFLVMALYNYFENRAVFLDELGTTDVLRREQAILSNLRLGQLLGEKGRFDEIRERLERARLNRDVDYYIATYKGEPLFWGTDDGKNESLLTAYEPGRDYITENVSFRAETIAPQTILMIGINKRTDAALAAYNQHYRQVFIEQALVLGLLALGIFAYYSRDFFSFVRALRGQDRKALRRIGTSSRESEILARGLLGYDASLKELSVRHHQLERQVLPSLKKEVFSGREPPYDFLCTMVRTDINNFSTIYNTHDVTDFMAVINEFFEGVSRIVARHQGLVHEFVGDEVIFYFKDSDCANSFSTALASLIEINRLAEESSRQTLEKHGYPFTVKSSLAHGQVRFGPLVNGFALAGSVLIETVRILSHVVEKGGNVIVFDSAHLPRVHPIFTYEPSMQVQLKGFNGQRALYAIRGRQSLTETIGHLDRPQNLEALGFFRADDELLQIMAALRGIENQSLVAEVLKILRHVPFWLSAGSVESAQALADELYAHLIYVDHSVRPPHERDGALVTSLTLMLIQNLVTADAFGDRLQIHLNGYLRDRDQRVVANALEVLTHFRSPVQKMVDHDLFQHADNRVVANAVVQEGMLQLSSAVIHRLRRSLSSSDGAVLASGLYAIGELARHHRSRDIIYYSTQIEFIDLIQSLPEHVLHQDSSVRKQAMLAARKSGDLTVIEEIRKKIDSDGRRHVIAEAQQVFESEFAFQNSSLKKSA